MSCLFFSKFFPNLFQIFSKFFLNISMLSQQPHYFFKKYFIHTEDRIYYMLYFYAKYAWRILPERTLSRITTQPTIGRMQHLKPLITQILLYLSKSMEIVFVKLNHTFIQSKILTLFTFILAIQALINIVLYAIFNLCFTIKL